MVDLAAMVTNLKTTNTDRRVQTTFLNFGPQHPSAHGVLRLIIEVSGERVKSVDPHIGLLHRGTEKLIEFKSFLQALPYFDRLDYVSTMSQGHTFCLAVESISDLTVNTRDKYIRVIFLELTRILNHLMGLTTHAFDVGAMTPLLWCFEDREHIMQFYERVSGARMHSSYFRPGGVSKDIPLGLLGEIFQFISNFSSRIDELEELLTENRLWKQRLKGVGVITQKDCASWGLTGVLSRSTGSFDDIRKNRPYECYSNISFRVPVGKVGDCFDRYIIRIEEMRQSINIINQCIQLIPEGPTPSSSNFSSMEKTINDFKKFSKKTYKKIKATYITTETPKGELGVYLQTDGSPNPTRCRIRSPGFFHLQAIGKMSKNLLIADVVTIIGTQDIVFGEVDR